MPLPSPLKNGSAILEETKVHAAETDFDNVLKGVLADTQLAVLAAHRRHLTKLNGLVARTEAALEAPQADADADAEGLSSTWLASTPALPEHDGDEMAPVEDCHAHENGEVLVETAYCSGSSTETASKGHRKSIREKFELPHHALSFTIEHWHELEEEIFAHLPDASITHAPTRRMLAEIIHTTRHGKAKKTEHRSSWHRVKATSTGRLVADSCIGCAIILNMFTIGLCMDVAPAWRGWIAIEGVFAALFFTESAAKIMMQGRKFFCGPGRSLNLFELLLVVFAIIDVVTSLVISGSSTTETLQVFRFLRLNRIARIVRLRRFTCFHDLMMILNGAAGGIGTLLWSMFLIAVPVYAQAVFLRQTLGDRAASDADTDFFSNLPEAMFTTFRCMVDHDCNNASGAPILVLVTQRFGWGFAMMYSFSVLLMSFGLFNVIVAIFVENAVTAARFNDASIKRKRLMDQRLFADRITELVGFIWRMCHTGARDSIRSSDSSGADDMGDAMSIEITQELFEELREFQEFQDILRDLDVKDEDQLNLFDTLDVDGGGTIDLEELVAGISKLRGDARRSDIISVGLKVSSVQWHLTRMLNTVEHRFAMQGVLLGQVLATFGIAQGVAEHAEENPDSLHPRMRELIKMESANMPWVHGHGHRAQHADCPDHRADLATNDSGHKHS